MADIIDTSTFHPSNLRKEAQLWAYCGFDACVTHEIDRETDKLLEKSPEAQLIYRFQQALQAPAMTMMLRGFRVDHYERKKLQLRYSQDRDRIEKHFGWFTEGLFDEQVNPQSPVQLQELLYKHLGIPPEYTGYRDKRKITTNREALEKIHSTYHRAIPFTGHIMAMRDLAKHIQVLKSGTDPDGRMRTSFNIGGTQTGRWSSSTSVFKSGTNLQNITDAMRRIFISDPGRLMAYLDLEQAESYVVGHLSGDKNYLAAIASGDLHTYVSRLVWPELPWNGDMKKDKAIAGQPFYRHFSHRDMSKRGGHAYNYYGTPPTVARHLKIPGPAAADFQDRYFDQFPAVREWHGRVAEQLQTTAAITTLLGRKRIFFGRLDDNSTLRKAIAYEPQSVVGDILNLGMYRIWKELDLPDDRAQLLGQLHDAVTLQVEEGDTEALEIAKDLMTIPVPTACGTMEIPVEIQVGHRWSHYNPSDPECDPRWDLTPLDAGRPKAPAPWWDDILEARL